MFHPFRIGILVLSSVMFLLSGVVFAASPNAIVSVEVKNGTEADAVNLSKVYVVMYNVAVVNDEWLGKKVSVKKIPAGKTKVTFVVKPGQVVDFKVFETFEDVNTGKKQHFYSPPFKNFSDTGDAGKLCYVAGVDFSEKLPDVPCTNKLKLDYSGSDAKISVGVNDGGNDSKSLSGVSVGMYNVEIVDGEWWGELVQVKSILAWKKQVVFSVVPGQIVDFLAFNNVEDANKVKKYQFTVPPHENFSGTYDENGVAQDGFCIIAGVDISKKLQSNAGGTFCGNEVELVLQK
jgi:hypothetical protein